MSYLIPSGAAEAEIEIQKSRFLAKAGMVSTVKEAKAFISEVKEVFPDANHHVYAYRIGNENSVIEGMSDDGEPSGTSGPPVLAILRGSGIGDIIIVVTRYFGGKKLGTGGLVRAYSEAARSVLENLNTELKISRTTLQVQLPYHLYEPCKKLIEEYEGEIIAEQFASDVSVKFILADAHMDDLRIKIRDASSGQVILPDSPARPDAD